MVAPILAAPMILAGAKPAASMALAKFGIPIAGGIMQIPAVKERMRSITQPGVDKIKESIDKVKAGRGYTFGYDTTQTPFEVAKERGLAGVVGGFADNMTGNRFDFDKRGESKKQKDTKEFLRKFIFGTDGMIKKADPVQIDVQIRQANPAGAIPGFEFPDSKMYVPGKTQFGGFS